MEYIVHEAAEKLGVSIPTLHYYEKAGLLPPIKRGTGKTRLYTEENLDWIYMIICLRESGLSIQDIREYVQLLLKGPDTMAQRLDLVNDYRRNIEEKIDTMKRSLLLLDQKSHFYSRILNAAEDIPCSNFSEEWEMFKLEQKIRNGGISK